MLAIALLSFTLAIYFSKVGGGEAVLFTLPSLFFTLIKLYEMDFKEKKHGRFFWFVYWITFIFASGFLVFWALLFWRLSTLPPDTPI